MDYAPKTFVDGQLPNTKTDLVVVGAGRSFIIRSMIMVNTHTAPVTVHLYANFGTGSRCIIPKDMILDPGVKYEEDFPLSLETGNRIEGYASMAAVVDFVISGVEAT